MPLVGGCIITGVNYLVAYRSSNYFLVYSSHQEVSNNLLFLSFLCVDRFAKNGDNRVLYYYVHAYNAFACGSVFAPVLSLGSAYSGRIICTVRVHRVRMRYVRINDHSYFCDRMKTPRLLASRKAIYTDYYRSSSRVSSMWAMPFQVRSS